MERYISDISTLIGAERLTVADGKAKGTELIRVYNGKIQLLLVVDQALNIHRFDYKGITLNFISKNGLVSPNRYNDADVVFGGYFNGGFLYTCGLDNFGEPKNIDGTDVVQHGTLSYIPAENIVTRTYSENGQYFVSVEGDVKFTRLFGSKLVLHRKITLGYLSNEVTIEDSIANESYTHDKYFLLYHINLGYPLLTEKTVIESNDIAETKGDDRPDIPDDRFDTMLKPQDGAVETMYYHTMQGSDSEMIVRNGNLAVKFNVENLPYIMEWKSMVSGDYALGIEPCNTSYLDMQPTPIDVGEKHSFKIKVTVEG